MQAFPQQGPKRSKNPVPGNAQRVCTDVDTGKSKNEMGCCPSCKHNTEECEELLSKALVKYESTNLELKECQKRNEALTQALAEKYHEQNVGNTENSAHLYTPKTISDMLKTLKDGLWDHILDKSFKDRDREGYSFLADLLQRCYELCDQKAKSQISEILDPFASDKTYVHNLLEKFETGSIQQPMTEKNFKALESVYRARYTLAQSSTESAPEKQNLIQFVLEDSYVEDFMRRNTLEESSFKKYIEHCVECCWPMVIVYPKLNLIFPSKGTKVDSRFFSCMTMDSDVTEQGFEKDIIVQGVWPALVHHNGALIKRGEVIVTSKSTL